MAKGLDPDEILADEDESCAMICTWYWAHHSAGGDENEVVKQLLEEIAAQLETNIPAVKGGGGPEH